MVKSWVNIWDIYIYTNNDILSHLAHLWSGFHNLWRFKSHMSYNVNPRLINHGPQSIN